MINISSITLVV